MELRKTNEFESQSEKTIRPFGIRDKVGYLCGDFGNDFMFIFASMYLMVFYTKVWGISATLVGTLFLVSRCIDAFTDITMGRIVDKCKTTPQGKFRPWIKRMAGPVAISSFLMYQHTLADASMTVKVVVMFVTYILWGSVFYTSINIPYGSMASAISDKPEERAALSTWRSLGAAFAVVIIGTVVPQIIYSMDANGNQIVSGPKFTLIAGIFSICAIICYILCYKLTTERVHLEVEEKESASLAQTFKTVVSNKALLSILAAAIVLLLSSFMSQTMNTYLFADYFKDINALSMINFVNLPINLLLAAVAVKISAKYGKKEFAAAGMILASVVFGIAYFLKIQNPMMFVALSTVSLLGTAVFNMLIWAKITDVIDYNEVKFGERNDGIIYGVYSFSRKIGQALAGGLGGFALGFIGYNSLAASQSAEVTNGIYTLSTLFPAVCYLIVALILIFAYPLGKKAVQENNRILSEKRMKNN